MKIACLLLAIPLTSPAFAQSSIERIVTTQVITVDAEAIQVPRVVGAGVTDCLFPSCTDFLAAGSDIRLAPGLAGVEQTRVRIETLFTAGYEFTLLATDPAGTYFRVVADGYTSNCGGGAGCTWGNSDGTELLFGVPRATSPLAVGETVTHVRAHTHLPGFGGQADVIDLEPGDFGWPYFLQDPGYYARVRIDAPRISVTQGDDTTPTAAVILSGAGAATSDITASSYFELAETPLLQTCVSQPNATGATGSLRAYGSRVSGTEWLTVRSSQLPPNQACLLFMGTEPAFIPAGSFDLCVGGPLTREGGAQITNAAGEAEHEISLLGRPAGSTLYVQVIHRDPVLGVAATEAGAFFVE